MNKVLEQILARAATWPREAQAQLAQAAQEIEQRQSGLVRATAAERDLIDEGLTQAERGEFVSDTDMEQIWRRNAGRKASDRSA